MLMFLGTTVAIPGGVLKQNPRPSRCLSPPESILHLYRGASAQRGPEDGDCGVQGAVYRDTEIKRLISHRQSAAELAHKPRSSASQSHCEIMPFFQLDPQALFLALWFLSPSWKRRDWALQTLCNSIPLDCN